MGMFEKFFGRGENPAAGQKPIPSLPKMPGKRIGVANFDDKDYATGGENINPELPETGPIDAPEVLVDSLAADRARRLQEAQKRALGQN